MATNAFWAWFGCHTWHASDARFFRPMALFQLSPTKSLDDFSHVIQLAIAPVFLLTAVGTLLMVLTNRLGRAVDRRRVLEVRIEDGVSEAIEARARGELELIALGDWLLSEIPSRRE